MLDGQQSRQTGILEGGGEIGALMRSFDWSLTPMGPIDRWPQSLKTVVRIMLDSRYSMWMGWGPELTFFYNDAYRRDTLGKKHPWALGRPVRDVWAEVWADIGPRIDRVMETGEATWDEGLLLFLERSGYTEETYHRFSYSPLYDDDGKRGGIFCVVTEETERIIADRRATLLREVASSLAAAKSETEAFMVVERVLAGGNQDLPFTLTYLFDHDSDHAKLVSSSGMSGDSAAASTMNDSTRWPFMHAVELNAPVVVDDLSSRFEVVPRGPWQKPAVQALLIPIAQQGQARPAGIFVAGLNPHRALDDGYRGFVNLFVGQVASAVANSRAYEEERKRVQALAEIDRAKTTFFSNVSHELRTPLTLILSPVEESLSDPGTPPALRERLDLAYRNSLRLLKLVNSLLDFSRIEAGRMQASFEPTDCRALTADLASVFRSAVERAGMRLVVECQDIGEPVYLDRDMWEKVVLNLLSNAFKYTLTGQITLSLRRVDQHVELSVHDTGVGIPERELPNLFQRFHRIEGTHGRTHEGTGIGLALVQELVKLHGGSIRVESTEGVGSTFTVSIPLGESHLPPARVNAARRLASSAIGPNAYVDEALRWLPPGQRKLTEQVKPATTDEAHSSDIGHGARVVLADDNADMREYVEKLLTSRGLQVEAVGDGQAALSAIRRKRPDVVLTDVMMPRLDGFGLLRAIRADPSTAGLAVMLLSARAGEEAVVEGLEAGADDYIIKPFSARELLAKLEGRLALVIARRQAAKREDELRAETTNVLESITEGFIAMDPQWSITYANAAAEQLTSTRRDDMIGRTLWEVFPGTVGSTFEAQYRQTAASRVPGRFDEFYEPMGIHFEVNSFPLQDGGVAIYFRDITDRKRAEARERQAALDAIAAAEANAKFRTFFEQGTYFAGVMALDGTVIEANRVCLDECGYTREQVIGRKFWECGWWNQSTEKSQQIKRASNEAARGKVFECETSYFQADGTERVLDLILSPVKDNEGRVLFIAATGPDVTDKKRFADEREGLLRAERNARAEAERVSRLKDEFLATLSHELRTPLNAILGWAQLLKRGGRNEEDFSQGMDAIERNARSQTQLIEDLLDMSRIIAGKVRLDVQRVSLAEVVNSAIEAVLPGAQAKGVRLEQVLDPLASQVSGDPNRLQQVIWNLLSNAIKFTSRGGKVIVVLERVNSHVEVSVTDTGKGIKPEFLPFVFERFRQEDASTTRQYGGLGIGLSIVKHLIELHGGSVRAKSQGEGHGASFIIALPLSAVSQHRNDTSREHPTRSAIDGGDFQPPDLLGVKVLVVDDDRDAREVLSRILSDSNATILTASSASEGLSILQSSRPHVLISDIGMPDIDGYQFIRNVRSLPVDLGGATPAIALTAFARSEDRRRALIAGFQMHVAKPVEPAELLTVCASLAGLIAPDGRQ